MYAQTININLVPSGVPPVIHVSQYEEQLNAFTFRLYNGAEAFNIPSNAAVLMNGLKPDGNVFSFAAASTSGNTAVFNCEQQMVPLPGRVVCELRVRTSSEIIGTCNFLLQVEESPLHDDSVISETTIPLIEQAIDIAANLAEYIETTLDARDKAVASAAAAKESEDNAAIYNSNVEQTYNSIETAKQNANTAAASATAAAAKLSNISATATTLSEGSSATASYDSNTGVMTFGIPRGATGESGIQTPISGMYALAIDADGYLYCYSNDEITESMFSYDEEEGNLYWMSPTTPIVTSVSGNMVTFVNKSSAENAVEVTSGIAPIQSFNGYDAPWPAGGGKNLLNDTINDIGTFSGVTVSQNEKGQFVLNGTATMNNSIRVGVATLPAGSYVLNGMKSTGDSSTFFMNISPKWDGVANQNLYSGEYSGTSDTERQYTVRIYFRSGQRFNNMIFEPMIRLASESDATFAPYSNICPISGWTEANIHVSPTTDAADGTSYTITFPTEAGTVYGGTLDVTTGELVVDKGYIASYSGESIGDPWISDRDAYTAGATPTNGAQVVYPLAEPITYQLTPQNIKILKGTNNIWSDSGDVTVKYNRWELE